MNGSLSTPLFVMVAVALLIFGPSKIAELGRSNDEAISGCKKSISDDDVKRERTRADKPVTRSRFLTGPVSR